MVKRSQFAPVHIRSPRHPSRVSNAPAMLADVEARFAQFRAEHRSGTRVPDDLREAAVKALRAGVPAAALFRTCRISWSQLKTWNAAHQSAVAPRVRSRRVAPANVRVFSVVDEESGDRTSARSAEQDLELRFGRWSLRIRLAEPARGE